MKLVQFGDLHLDAPLEKFSAQKSRELRRRTRELLCRTVELAEAEKADAILCTGDLFDSTRPYLDSVLYAAEQFSGTEIPVFIAPGNHDPFTASCPYRAVSWPKNVHVFSSALPQTLEFPLFRITGWANTEARQSHCPLEGFSCEKDPLRPHILLFHGEVGNDSPYFHATAGELSSCGADYIAMGHVHGHFIRRFGDGLGVMNGGVQALKMGEWGEKGAVVAEVSPGGARARLVPLGGMRSFELTLRDGELSDPAELCPYPAEDTLLSLTLLGEKLSSPGELSALTEGFLQVALKDGRRESRSVPSGKSLGALFARRAKEEGLSELATEFGLAALENREQPREQRSDTENDKEGRRTTWTTVG